MTLLEVMNLGNQVIETNVRGNPKIVEHERTGLLASPGSVVDFLSAKDSS
ncbi:hypothetical protein MELB17_14311 [Marinobacter sp. ELB17]|nr:hypothetical protein MELB17_14311 [Marinobacter sp. ELB17]